MIDETYLTPSFPENNIPAFPCPTCGASLASHAKDPALTRESKASSDYYRESGEVEAQFGTFTLWLQCVQKSCCEPACCIGEYHVQVDGPPGNEYLNTYLKPQYFLPTIPLFRPPNNLPDNAAAALSEAFSLFWSNPAASANSLRVALEHIMDHFGVKKLTRNLKGKRVRLNLHDRIVIFGKKRANTEIAQKLLALKWIGNYGSHSSGLRRDDVISAIRLFEYVLEELFQKRTHNLTKLANKINRQKGPKLPRRLKRRKLR